MSIKAVIFDLDGVIVSTDEYHFQAWKKIADEEGIHFDKEINDALRGVSRMESLDIILRGSKNDYAIIERKKLADRKNSFYRESLENLTPEGILLGVISLLEKLRARKIKIAIASSSKNASIILEKIGLHNIFDAVVDGNEIKNSKPNPEVFLLAAHKLGIRPEDCVVVEDAEAGIEAALAAGMITVGVGRASACLKAHYKMKDLSNFSLNEIIE